MKVVFHAVLAGLAALATAARADAADPLWVKAQARAAATRGWVAETVRSHTVADEEGKPRRSGTAVATLSGWNGATPQRKVTAEGDAELGQLAERALPAPLNPADRPDAVLLEATSVEREGSPQGLAGRTAQAFKVSGTLGRRKTVFSGSILVDATSGDLIAVNYDIDPSSLRPAMRYQVRFALPDTTRPALPESSELQVDANVPLLGHLVMRQTALLSRWTTHPPAAPPTAASR